MPCVVELLERLNRLIEYRWEHASGRGTFPWPERRGEDIHIEIDVQWLQW
jgi:hypothetical protein